MNFPLKIEKVILTIWNDSDVVFKWLLNRRQGAHPNQIQPNKKQGKAFWKVKNRFHGEVLNVLIVFLAVKTSKISSLH